MRKKMLLGLLFLALLNPGWSLAKTMSYTLSPPFSTVDIAAGDQKKEIVIDIGNNTDLSQSFKLLVIDFGNLDESGGIQFLGIESEKIKNYKYSLTSWLVLEKDQVVVGPKQTEKVKVSVVNKESLSPGGHYGAVLVSQIDDGIQKDAVGVNQAYASLLFVKKSGGGEVIKLELKKIVENLGILKIPDNVSLRFQNSGNVHIIPRGVVTMVDPWGRVVKKGNINIDSQMILPESFRIFRVPIITTARVFIPGIYQIKVMYRAGGTENWINFGQSFFWAGNLVIGGGILLVIFVLVLTVKVMKLYKKI